MSEMSQDNTRYTLSTVRPHILVLIVYIPHAQVIMLLWSYFTAVATDPGRVPPGWHPFCDEEVCPELSESCFHTVELASPALFCFEGG